MTMTNDEAQAVIDRASRGLMTSARAQAILNQGQAQAAQGLEVLWQMTHDVIRTTEVATAVNKSVLEAEELSDEAREALTLQTATNELMTATLTATLGAINKVAEVSLVAALEAGAPDVDRDELLAAVKILGPQAIDEATARIRAESKPTEHGGMYL